ncbi:MAG TPA: response regulator [Thermoanaerobaculia bacterium]
MVEDEDAIRALLFTVFRRRGFSVDTAKNGLEALARCAVCNYAVILLDMMMPLMTGQEFIDALAEKNDGHRPVVIVLTAGASTRNLNPAVVAGSIKKPFDVELLVDTVAACINTSADIVQPADCPPAESETENARARRGNDPA